MSAPALVLTTDDAAARSAAASLFARAALVVLPPALPAAPALFDHELFALLASQPAGSCVGLVVPVTGRGPAGCAGPAAPLLPVADHVNLALRGPLTGRWPPGVPRTFPVMAGIYQPGVVRAAGGARVYSSGVVVAGVSDASRLTPFEARAARDGGLSLFSDVLVPVAVVASYHGLTLAACAVPQADDREHE